MKCTRSLLATMVVSTLAMVATTAAAQRQSAIAVEHVTVIVDGHSFSVWASRPAHPRAAILLVHGRTWSARPAFDLHLPHENRSVLERLSAAGYAAYAVDLRGYGATPRDSSGWLTPRRSALDVEGVLEWITTQSHVGAEPVLFGWSRGARIVAMVASRGKVPLSALVLSAYTYDPNAEVQPFPPDSVPARAQNTAKAAASDFKTPDVASQAAIDAFVASALASNPVRVDLKGDEEFHDIVPASIHTRTLLIQGERDPGIDPSVESKLFASLGTGDREWVVIAGGDHAAHLENTFPNFMTTLISFLNGTVIAQPTH